LLARAFIFSEHGLRQHRQKDDAEDSQRHKSLVDVIDQLSAGGF